MSQFCTLGIEFEPIQLLESWREFSLDGPRSLGEFKKPSFKTLVSVILAYDKPGITYSPATIFKHI